MNINKIKKCLYKEKPIAKLVNKADNNDLTYETMLNNNVKVTFIIPSNETFDADGKYIYI